MFAFATLLFLLLPIAAFGFPASASFSTQPSRHSNDILATSRKQNQAPLSTESLIPDEDTIICPSSEVIIPIYGSPSEHHSYMTAIDTFCQRDLADITHTKLGNTVSLVADTSDTDEKSFEVFHRRSSLRRSTIFIAQDKPLARAYRITMITGSDATEMQHHNSPYHFLFLEISNNAPNSVQITNQDCVANFMAIVETAGGCRVSDTLTKPGEFRAGRGNERGFAGLVFKASQWR